MHDAHYIFVSLTSGQLSTKRENTQAQREGATLSITMVIMQTVVNTSPSDKDKLRPLATSSIAHVVVKLRSILELEITLYQKGQPLWIKSQS